MKFSRKFKIIAPVTFVFALVVAGGIWALVNKATKFNISADVTPQPTTLVNTCGMDITMVMDISASIDKETELVQMQTALTSFVDAFVSLPTQFSLVTFNESATVVSPFTSDPTAIKAAINGVTLTEGNTNWEIALNTAKSIPDPRQGNGNLILMASDGGPNLSSSCPAGSTSAQCRAWIEDQPVNHAIVDAQTAANSIKASGTRIIGVAIGLDSNGMDDSGIDKFKEITGGPSSKIAPPFTADTDIIETNFGDMSQDLAALSNSMCSNTIMIQKMIDTNGDGTAELTGETPHADLASFNFALSDGPTSRSSLTTNQTGAIEFPTLAVGNYTITEASSNDYLLTHVSCTKNNESVGTTNPATNSISNLPITQGDNIFCVFINKPSNPAVPKIGLSVSVAPTGVPIGGGTVVFSYTVTNPSSIVLTNVGITDKQCSPISPLINGDTNGDGKLQSNESWRYACTTTTTSALTSEAVVTGYYNGAPVTASGTASVSIIPAGPPQTGKQ